MPTISISEPCKRKGSSFYYVQIFFSNKSGKRRHTWRSTKQSELRAARAQRQTLWEEMNAALSKAEIHDSDRQPIGDYFKEYFRTHGPSLAASTADDYRSILDTLEQWFNPKTALCDLTRAECKEWVYGAKTESQQMKRFRVIKAVLNEALADDKLSRTPITFRAPKISQGVPDIFDDDLNEFARFYEQMPEVTQRDRDIKFFSYLGYATGLRNGEIANLRLSDLHWPKRRIWIRNTERHRVKNRRDYFVSITPQVEDALLMQLKSKASSSNPNVRDSPFLFSNSVGCPYVDKDGKPRPISKMFCKVRKSILPARPGLHVHSLRHSVGQNAYDHGVPLRDITMQLNHKSEAITAKYYARVGEYHRSVAQYASMEEYLSSRPPLSRRVGEVSRKPEYAIENSEGAMVCLVLES